MTLGRWHLIAHRPVGSRGKVLARVTARGQCGRHGWRREEKGAGELREVAVGRCWPSRGSEMYHGDPCAQPDVVQVGQRWCSLERAHAKAGGAARCQGDDRREWEVLRRTPGVFTQRMGSYFQQAGGRQAVSPLRAGLSAARRLPLSLDRGRGSGGTGQRRGPEPKEQPRPGSCSRTTGPASCKRLLLLVPARLAGGRCKQPSPHSGS